MKKNPIFTPVGVKDAGDGKLVVVGFVPLARKLRPGTVPRPSSAGTSALANIA
jgi:hypothetical protein